MAIIIFADIVLQGELCGRPGSVSFDSTSIYISNTAYNTDMYVCTKNTIDLSKKSKLSVNFTDNGGWTYSGTYTKYYIVLLNESPTGNYPDSWPSGLSILKDTSIGPSKGATRTVEMDVSDYNGTAVIGFRSGYSGNCTIHWITVE